jgi:hypothetical protein
MGQRGPIHMNWGAGHLTGLDGGSSALKTAGWRRREVPLRHGGYYTSNIMSFRRLK